MTQNDTLRNKWEAEYIKQKSLVTFFKSAMKPHQKAMKHARVMRNQYK